MSELEERMFLAGDIRDELAETTDLPFGERNRIAWDTVDAVDYDTDPALPELLAEARKTFPPANCRLGPTEHDGSRFCHVHVGRVHPGSPTPWQCSELGAGL